MSTGPWASGRLRNLARQRCIPCIHGVGVRRSTMDPVALATGCGSELMILLTPPPPYIYRYFVVIYLLFGQVLASISQTTQVHSFELSHYLTIHSSHNQRATTLAHGLPNITMRLTNSLSILLLSVSGAVSVTALPSSTQPGLSKRDISAYCNDLQSLASEGWNYLEATGAGFGTPVCPPPSPHKM